MAPTNLSGTYNFSPSLGELVLFAFGKCGIRRTAIVQEHMQDARISANMILADWLNRGVNLWQVELVTIPLVAGVATYPLDPNVFVMLDTYVTIAGPGPAIDRLILPVGRSEYASYPNKQQQGFPTVYWMDRILAPNVTLWPVPDGQQVSLSTYVLRQAQDAGLASGQQPEVPLAWLKAFAYALAVELAFTYAPDRVATLKPEALEAYNVASSANVETAMQYFSPMIGSYFRT